MSQDKPSLMLKLSMPSNSGAVPMPPPPPPAKRKIEQVVEEGPEEYDPARHGNNITSSSSSAASSSSISGGLTLRLSLGSGKKEKPPKKRSLSPKPKDLNPGLLTQTIEEPALVPEEEFPLPAELHSSETVEYYNRTFGEGQLGLSWEFEEGICYVDTIIDGSLAFDEKVDINHIIVSVSDIAVTPENIKELIDGGVRPMRIKFSKSIFLYQCGEKRCHFKSQYEHVVHRHGMRAHLLDIVYYECNHVGCNFKAKIDGKVQAHKLKMHYVPPPPSPPKIEEAHVNPYGKNSFDRSDKMYIGGAYNQEHNSPDLTPVYYPTGSTKGVKESEYIGSRGGTRRNPGPSFATSTSSSGISNKRGGWDMRTVNPIEENHRYKHLFALDPFDRGHWTDNEKSVLPKGWGVKFYRKGPDDKYKQLLCTNASGKVVKQFKSLTQAGTYIKEFGLGD